MKRVNYAALLAVLCVTAAGCAGLPSERAQLPDGSGTGYEAVDAGSEADVSKREEAAALSEEYGFLEEGSGFALQSLSDAEKLWYGDIERILGGFGTEVNLSKEALEAGLDEEDLDRIFQCVMNDHPELFYVEGYSYTKYTKSGQDDVILSLEFSGRYSMDPETAKQRAEEIRGAAGEILAGIDAGADQYEKVKYVYDTLIRQTDYSLEAEDNQNIYSVFVNHRSVCQGYAKATQYLLNRLGVECALVLGTVQTGEGHAWNLVNVDGGYYYVDTTWGDASYRIEEGEEEESGAMPEINYDYLNVTTDELLRTHTPQEGQQLPLCTDTAANYYVREGALFADYDREQMEALFEKTLAQGREDVTIKCADGECYRAICGALIEGQEIFDYLPDGGESVAYTRNDKQRSLTFWVTNE